MASFSSVIGSVALTMFWNMVLFLRRAKQARRRSEDNHQSTGQQCECGISRDLLEVKGQIGGDDAYIKQVLHVLKLALLEVAEDVQCLQKKGEEY